VRTALLFRLLTLATLVGASGWLAYYLWGRHGSLRRVLEALVAGPYSTLDGPSSGATRGNVGAVAYAGRLAYLVAVVCVVLLALTGFVPYVVFGTPLAGLALLVHVLVAPVFSVSVTALCLLWAHDQQLDEANRRRVSHAVLGSGERPADTARSTARKICFWLLAVLTPLILGSIMLSMYPILGTAGQESLRTVHFASTWAFLVVATVRARLSVPVPE